MTAVAMTRTFVNKDGEPMGGARLRLTVRGTNTPLPYALIPNGPLLRGGDITADANGKICVYPSTPSGHGFRLTMVNVRGSELHTEDSSSFTGTGITMVGAPPPVEDVPVAVAIVRDLISSVETSEPVKDPVKDPVAEVTQVVETLVETPATVVETPVEVAPVVDTPVVVEETPAQIPPETL